MAIKTRDSRHPTGVNSPFIIIWCKTLYLTSYCNCLDIILLSTFEEVESCIFEGRGGGRKNDTKK